MSLAFLHGEVTTGGRTQDGSGGSLEGPSGNLRYTGLALPLEGGRHGLAGGTSLAGLRMAERRLPEAVGRSEKMGFWYGGGAGVKGFAGAGVTGSATGKGGASYGWWAGFLHNFVIPNASWIAKLVTLTELAIGVLLVLGLFTGAAAFAGSD